ncbi:MAG: DUF1611 domain-containing protein [Candidatus Acidiferrum sp.]
MRISYALRWVPNLSISTLLPCPIAPQAGDIVLARMEKIGKNATLELANGRRCTLHEGDLLAVVFGNRYATLQFEGYARSNGDSCDMLSMGGLCGLVESKHAKAADPSKLRLLGALGDRNGTPLNLRDFALAPIPQLKRPNVIVVCGTSMDAGKTHTVMSLIMGLRKQGLAVAGIKLTGTATGKDTWNMLDAGACAALDFVDGGFPSTYLSTLEELLHLYDLLISRAAAAGASWVVVEIADGLLQRETAALVQHAGFAASVGAWIFASGDPLAAAGGVEILRKWGIEPLAISGVVSMSPLGMQETRAATALPCLTASELQAGALNSRLQETVSNFSGSFLASAGRREEILHR